MQLPVARVGWGGERQQAESGTPWSWKTVRRGILCFWVREDDVGWDVPCDLPLHLVFWGVLFVVQESCACSVNGLPLRYTLGLMLRIST